MGVAQKSIKPHLNHLMDTRALSPSSGTHQGVQVSQIVRLALLGLLTSQFFSHSAYATAPYLNFSSSAPSGLVSFSKVQPSSAGEMSTASDTLTVNTNCTVGYNVYVSATSTGDTNLTNDSASTGNVISASSAVVGGTSTALSANTWGINSIDDNTYYGLPSYAQATTNPLVAKTSVSTTSTVPIYYGAKVTTSLAPGSYTGEVLYTVLPNVACTHYTVHFNANGGTGTMNNQTITTGQATKLTANTYTRSGYTFLGWSNSANGKTGTAANGIGTSSDVDYTNQQSVTDITDFNTTKNLYAIWIENHTVNYNTNSATSGTPSKTTDGTVLKSDSITTATVNTMTKTGYHFMGWGLSSSATSAKYSANTSVNISTLISDAATAGQTTTAGSTITLYAIWAKNTFTISYNANGGTGSASKTSETATYGTSITMPTQNTLVKSGYNFLGWSLSSTATSATWTAGQSGISPTAIKSNVTTTNGGSKTVYAVWRKPYMQTTSCSSLTVNATTTLYDSRDEQDYTVYRFPNTGTAGTNYPTGMAGYCIMTKDLSLGYVTGGSITKDANLVLTEDDSVAAGTIVHRTKSNWSSSNADTNLQYTNGTNATYGVHSYYSWGAAKKVCPKGWTLPTRSQYSNTITFLGGSSNGAKKIRGEPYNFVLGGRLLTSGWADVGSNGWYWTSTQKSSDTTQGSDMGFKSSSALAVNYSDKRNGDSVRCIAVP